MRPLVFVSMILGYMAGCGTSEALVSALHSGYPDAYPLNIKCWGASLSAPGSTFPVNYDQPSDVKLCAIKQKDGHIGLNLRYRKSAKDVYAALHVRDRIGTSRSGLFTMRAQNANQDLYVSDGCVEGSYGGCARKGSPEMQDLMSDLLLIENGKVQTFQVDVRFLAITPAEFESGAYDLSKEPVFSFFVAGL